MTSGTSCEPMVTKIVKEIQCFLPLLPKPSACVIRSCKEACSGSAAPNSLLQLRMPAPWAC